MHGGAVLLSAINAHLNHNTFADNFLTSQFGASGRDLYGSNRAKVYIENNLFADTTSPPSAAPFLTPAQLAVSQIGSGDLGTGGELLDIISMGHNLTTDNSLSKVVNYSIANGDISNGTQLLEPKALNGGLTPDYALVPGGQAIGNGDDVGPPIDQDGHPRPVPPSGHSSIGSTDNLTPSPSPVPLVFVVNNSNDSGPGSLRDAVLDADAHGQYSEIDFDSSASPYNIVLTSGAIPITVPMQINASGSNRSGFGASRVQGLYVGPAVEPQCRPAVAVVEAPDVGRRRGDALEALGARVSDLDAVFRGRETWRTLSGSRSGSSSMSNR
jgi:hypothetical protein